MTSAIVAMSDALWEIARTVREINSWMQSQPEPESAARQIIVEPHASALSARRAMTADAMLIRTFDGANWEVAFKQEGRWTVGYPSEVRTQYAGFRPPLHGWTGESE